MLVWEFPDPRGLSRQARRIGSAMEELQSLHLFSPHEARDNGIG